MLHYKYILSNKNGILLTVMLYMDVLPITMAFKFVCSSHDIRKHDIFLTGVSQAASKFYDVNIKFDFRFRWVDSCMSKILKDG